MAEYGESLIKALEVKRSNGVTFKGDTTKLVKIPLNSDSISVSYLNFEDGSKKPFLYYVINTINGGEDSFGIHFKVDFEFVICSISDKEICVSHLESYLYFDGEKFVEGSFSELENQKEKIKNGDSDIKLVIKSGRTHRKGLGLGADTSFTFNFFLK